MTEEALLAVVSSNFRSVWPLELLVLLRHEPRVAWQVDALVRELRASVQAVNEGIVALRKLGMVIDDGEAYRFRASSAEQEELASELADLYSRKPRAIMRAILAAPHDKVQSFADAFRLRKNTC